MRAEIHDNIWSKLIEPTYWSFVTRDGGLVLPRQSKDEIKVDSSKESYGSMDMYVEKYANKFMAHKCNELFTGVMELVAVRE